MKTTITKTLAALALSAAFISCKKSKNDVPENPGNFVLAVTPVASTGVADYLLTAGSLDNGTVSIIGNGVEQDGTYRYYVTSGNKFFSLLYGQGNPGAVTVYDVQAGKLNKLNDFTAATVHAFAPVDKDILMVRNPRAYAAAGSTLANWYIVNTENNKQTAEGTFDAVVPTGNGEIAHLSWIKQVGNKVFAPFFSIYNSRFWTKFPDEAWIAVYTYPTMQLEKVIKDNRTSFIGRYFTDGLGLVENGDVYAFSTAVAVDDNTATTDVLTDSKLTSTKPSSITRIKAGTTEFDQSYLMNFETASNGYVITNWLYIGQNKFVANMEPKATKGAYVVGKRLAVVDVLNKTVSPVSGFPDVAAIASVTTNNYSPKDGRTGYIGVNLTDGTTWVYKIDAANNTAAKGLKVEGGLITAIQHVK
ncbi:DUF4374 domain-containing protein [Pedobacter heparinus]|uniref:DUF4374 domain-containing protein n=1 Tax=Pedobacter heparinus TaxID=984 RepID=UPI002930B506|nr:DUF4374 domain-containing protein [Pedobacter heparinus]